jgi:hypothetical protein
MSECSSEVSTISGVTHTRAEIDVVKAEGPGRFLRDERANEVPAARRALSQRAEIYEPRRRKRFLDAF